MLSPRSQKGWTDYAAWCVGQYPLMGVDWDAHRRALQLSAPVPEHLVDAVPYFDVEPMSEEEEEYAASLVQSPAQLELF